jgi:hypothetical protein
MRKLLFAIFVTLVSFGVLAATPNQYGPNASIPTAIDVTTSNSVVTYSDHGGAQYVNVGSTLATYRAVVADMTPAATATDVVTLCGSASKTIKLSRIQVTADATNPSVIDFYSYLRTAANTGGTSSVVATATLDQTNSAATAVVTKYTANAAALGAGILIAADHYALPAAASTGYPGMPWIEDFGIRNTQPVVLRGTANCFAFGMNGEVIPAGTVLYINLEWTEE